VSKATVGVALASNPVTRLDYAHGNREFDDEHSDGP
jgi:hypothetical protein